MVVDLVADSLRDLVNDRKMIETEISPQLQQAVLEDLVFKDPVLLRQIAAEVSNTLKDESTMAAIREQICKTLKSDETRDMVASSLRDEVF